MIKAKNLMISAILFIVLQALAVIFSGLEGFWDLAWIVQSVILMILSILLVASYKSHQKNVMKPLIGGTLLIFMFYEATQAAEFIQYFDSYVGLMVESGFFGVYVLIQVLQAIVLIILNINHYLINTTHAGSPQVVAANKFFYILFVIFAIAQAVVYALCGSSTFDTLSQVFGCISDIFMLAIIIIIEGLVDEFRIKRETNAAE